MSPTVRIEIGESAIFTKVEIDGRELPGITRVWFDSGDLNGADGPMRAWRNHTRVHIELLPASLVVVGTPDVDYLEVRPAVLAEPK